VGIVDEKDAELLQQIKGSRKSKVNISFDDPEEGDLLEIAESSEKQELYSEMEKFEDESEYLDDFKPGFPERNKSSKKNDEFYNGLDDYDDIQEYSDYDYDDIDSEW